MLISPIQVPSARCASLPTSPTPFASNAGRHPVARRLSMSITVPPSPTSALVSLTLGESAFPLPAHTVPCLPVLERRGYRVRSCIKQSLYGCVLLATPPSTVAATNEVAPAFSTHSQTGPHDNKTSLDITCSQSALVCVKVSRLWLASQLSSPDASGRLTHVRDRVLSEAALLRRLHSCEGVAPLVDEFSDDDWHFLVTRYAGKELFDVVSSAGKAQAGLPLDTVASHTKQLARAVATMHADGSKAGTMDPARGIAHLDLSLTNVCVEEGPQGQQRAAIIDFGVADDASGLLSSSSTTPPQIQLPSQMMGAAPCSLKRGSSGGSGLAQALAQTRLNSAAGAAAVATAPQAVGPLSPSSSASGRSWDSSHSDISSSSSSLMSCGSLGSSFVGVPVGSPLLHGRSFASFASPTGRSRRSSLTVTSSLLRSPAVEEEDDEFSLMRSGENFSSSDDQSPNGSDSSSSTSSSQYRSTSRSSCKDSLPVHVPSPATPIRQPHQQGHGTYRTRRHSRDSLSMVLPQSHEPDITILGSQLQPAEPMPLLILSAAATPLIQPQQQQLALSLSSRRRFDLPPSKQHCQSPEQRACALFHSSSSSQNAEPTLTSAATPGWCPFASDVYALGVMLYEMSTGKRWDAQVLEQPQQQTSKHGMSNTNAMDTSDDNSCRSELPPVDSRSVMLPAGMHPLAWDLVCQCTAPEIQRISAANMLRHPFLAAH